VPNDAEELTYFKIACPDKLRKSRTPRKLNFCALAETNRAISESFLLTKSVNNKSPSGAFNFYGQLIPVEILTMKRFFLLLSFAFTLGWGEQANAGVTFGIPLPFPFLVWVPSNHCHQKSDTNCNSQKKEQAVTTSKSSSSPTKAATSRNAVPGSSN
jgi:hypothetical protein